MFYPKINLDFNSFPTCFVTYSQVFLSIQTNLRAMIDTVYTGYLFLTAMLYQARLNVMDFLQGHQNPGWSPQNPFSSPGFHSLASQNLLDFLVGWGPLVACPSSLGVCSWGAPSDVKSGLLSAATWTCLLRRNSAPSPHVSHSPFFERLRTAWDALRNPRARESRDTARMAHGLRCWEGGMESKKLSLTLALRRAQETLGLCWRAWMQADSIIAPKSRLVCYPAP